MRELIEQLSSNSYSQRSRALKALTKLGPAAREAVPALVMRIEGAEEDTFLRKATASALGAIGPEAASLSIPGLVSAYDDKNWQVRDEAARAVAAVGVAGIPHLLRAAEDVYQAWLDQETRKRRRLPPDSERAWDKRMDVRAFMCAAVKAMGPPAVPALVMQLSKDEKGGIEAAVALGCLGPIAKAAVPDLQRVAESADGELRDEAAKALKAIRSFP